MTAVLEHEQPVRSAGHRVPCCFGRSAFGIFEAMPSSSQRRGRSRQQLQTHRAEALAKQADERDRGADERDRRWFMRNVIASGIISTIVSTITGWLFWRLPTPQPQGRDVMVSGGTRHGVRGSGTPRIHNVTAHFAAGPPTMMVTAQVVPAEPPSYGGPRV